MVLEQGKLVEFDRYGQEVSSSNDEKTNLLLCPQTCHLVERFDLQILFVVQSNGKRRICNIKKTSRSLDSSVYTLACLPLPSICISIIKISAMLTPRSLLRTEEIASHCMLKSYHIFGSLYIRKWRSPLLLESRCDDRSHSIRYYPSSPSAYGVLSLSICPFP